MYLELKEEIKNIIEVVQQCPEKFQERCFEILLNQCIEDCKMDKCENKTDHTQPQSKVEDKDEGIKCIDESEQNEEIKQTDFHIKIQRFMTTNEISISDINNLYYKENDKLLPLYETLGSTKMSECQMRIALLTAFENSYSDSNGDMYFNGEVVRQRCQAMKCYDTGNFSAIFKNNCGLIDNFNDKYDKNTNYYLSLEGKKKLAKIIMELVKEM